MSYARFSNGDAYIYSHVDGYFICQCCLLKGKFEDFSCKTRSEMISHIFDHLYAGHSIPDKAVDRLCQELQEEGETCDDESSLPTS